MRKIETGMESEMEPGWEQRRKPWAAEEMERRNGDTDNTERKNDYPQKYPVE